MRIKGQRVPGGFWATVWSPLIIADSIKITTKYYYSYLWVVSLDRCLANVFALRRALFLSRALIPLVTSISCCFTSSPTDFCRNNLINIYRGTKSLNITLNIKYESNSFVHFTYYITLSQKVLIINTGILIKSFILSCLSNISNSQLLIFELWMYLCTNNIFLNL